MKRRKLIPAEVERLVAHIAANGGQQKVGVDWNVNASTLSRVINLHHAPSPMLQKILVKEKIVLKT